MSISASYPTIRPSLLLDFSNSGRLDPRVTFTRASSATYFDATGTLQTATDDTPRFDYDPSTLAAQGLLIEESRTNSIRNNTMQDAVAGTPGTVPTNWTISAATGNLTTRKIVGVGIENGITYIDVQFVTSGAFVASAYADTSTGVAASNGQTWTTSFFVKLVGGSLTNVTVQTSIVENDSGGIFLAGADSATFVPTSAALSTQRVTQTRTNTNASTAFEWSRVKVNFTGAGDVTLRIGLPQLEQGAFATSVIPTTTTAVTRAPDQASVNTLSPWYNAAEGTLYAEVMLYALPPTGTFPAYADINNNSLERIGLSSRATADHRVTVRNTAGIIWDTNAGGAIVANTTSKWALAAKSGDFASAYNGVSGAVSSAAGMPAGLTQMTIGSSAGGFNKANAWIRRITYYPRRLSNAELQTITS